MGNIVIALTTTLAAVSAFYFGTKAAQQPEADEEKERKPRSNGSGRKPLSDELAQVIAALDKHDHVHVHARH